jgi:branched-chain amino acid transport system permease protein
MLGSILASGLAAGAIYALVGVTYNTMFSTSRVMSFTSGQLAMLGGVFGSMFMLKLGLPVIVGFVLTLVGCALIGVITEFVAVRPVLKNLDQHLYVLSTLALALMIQQVAAIKWGTEPQPFPRLIGWGSGVWDEKFWLPVVACAITVIGLEYLYRRTLVGRAFLAIAEDNFAARALGLPERNLRIASYALAGVIGGIAGFSGGELLLAFFANGALLNFYGFVPVAIGGLGNNRGAIIGGIALGLFQQAEISWSAASSRRSRYSRCSSWCCWRRRAACSARPRRGGCDDIGHRHAPAPRARPAQRTRHLSRGTATTGAVPRRVRGRDDPALRQQ